MLKSSIVMRMSIVKQFTLVSAIILMGIIAIPGCRNVILQVYSQPIYTKPIQDMLITTLYQDGSIEALRGSGTIQGKVRVSEIYTDTNVLTLFVQKNNGKEYKIRVPGWKNRITPVKSGLWVMVEYSFKEHSEWLRIMEQGHGQIFMYYNGNVGSNKTADPVIQCKFDKRLFLTSLDQAMTCRKVLAHFSVLCSSNKAVWPLAPGKIKIISGNKSKILKAGTRILHIVDAFRTKNNCGSASKNRLIYYWFKLPDKILKNKVVTHNDK